jgi:anti-sigma factor RsiW
MECGRDRAGLSAYLDGEAADGNELERHLESCAACRAELDELRALRRVLHVPRLEPDPFFLVRFRARREALERLSAESWRRVAVRLLLPATAAAALLALVAIRSGAGEPESFWDLERHALASGSPRLRSAPESSDLEPLLAAALGPREPVRPRVAGGQAP